MRIVLVPSSAPLTCVYCHDLLGTDALEGCRKCGTRYHKECAALAGSCGLIGCDGTFETASAGLAADARLALVLRPTSGPPTREQLAAVARVLRATEWDARQRLGTSAPLVLGYYTRQALAHATAELDAGGVSAFAIDAAALASGERVVVRSADRTERELVLRDERGAEHRLALGAPRILVVARYATETTERRDPLPSVEDRPGNSNAFRPKRRGNTRTTTFTRVLHAYRDAAPFVFDEALIDDFRFLGDAISASSTQNFQTLAAILGQGAVVDRSLEKIAAAHLRHLPESASYRGSRKTNRAWVDAASLLVYHSNALPDEPAKDAKGE